MEHPRHDERTEVGNTSYTERVQESRRGKLNQTSCQTIEGFVKTDKIVSLYCQQDHFPDRCIIVANANTRQKILQCQ